MASLLLSKRDSVGLSRKLSKTLRHQAQRMGLHIGTDGRIEVDELLRHGSFRGVTLDQIRYVVDENDKKRFELEEVGGVLKIRAVQGHSMKLVSDEELLVEVVDPTELPVCVHGTTKAALPAIMGSGLSRMKRNHIHMAIGVPGDDDVISGMRSSSQVIIHVDVKNAMMAGVKFFRASNGVILTKGVNDDGILPVTFFSCVEDRSSHSTSGSTNTGATASTAGGDAVVDCAAADCTSKHAVSAGRISTNTGASADDSSSSSRQCHCHTTTTTTTTG
mmetsp:Transcript_27098/g.45386  ORF Transcript_27098/g.45386 Transcript_27098/m.45386 type:complete len:276 (+) Transcript_27098:363-1190(+)